MNGANPIRTARLFLRELTEADAPTLLLLNGNPNVLRHLSEPPLTDTAQVLEMLHTRIFPQYRNHGVGRFGICLHDGGALIGWCGLKFLAETNEYDLGYRLLESHWGQGYAFEAARAVLDWGRPRLPGRRIVGQARTANRASIRILEKLGFLYEKTVEEPEGPTAVYVYPS